MGAHAIKRMTGPIYNTFMDHSAFSDQNKPE